MFFSKTTISSIFSVILLSNAQQCFFKFNLDKYTGGWFEIASTKFVQNTIERGCECSNVYYTRFNETQLNVTNTCTRNSQNFTVKGFASVLGENSLHVSFPEFPVFFENKTEPNYIVEKVYMSINGDYEKVIVKGSSDNFLWFLSRTPMISDSEFESMINDSLVMNLNVTNLVKSQQDNCTLYYAQDQ